MPVLFLSDRVYKILIHLGRIMLPQYFTDLFPPSHKTHARCRNQDWRFSMIIFEALNGNAGTSIPFLSIYDDTSFQPK